MPNDQNKMLSVSQVYELIPGDAANATWINPGMIAVVQKITRFDGAKTRWTCLLADQEGGSAPLEMTLFTAPKFKDGDTIEIFGKGFRRTEYNGKAQVTTGKDTEIHVVAKGSSSTNGAAPAASGHQNAPTGRPGDNTEFHRTMKRIALTYCHAIDYAAEIDKRIHFVTPEHHQACVATLFIEASRRNLIDIAPGRGTQPAPDERPKVEALKPRYQPTEAEQANLTGKEEDVPF